MLNSPTGSREGEPARRELRQREADLRGATFDPGAFDKADTRVCIGCGR